MYTQMMKWVSISALLVAMVFWNTAANYQWELSLVVSVAAAVVLAQAFQVKKYRGNRQPAGWPPFEMDISGEGA